MSPKVFFAPIGASIQQPEPVVHDNTTRDAAHQEAHPTFQGRPETVGHAYCVPSPQGDPMTEQSWGLCSCEASDPGGVDPGCALHGSHPCANSSGVAAARTACMWWSTLPLETSKRPHRSGMGPMRARPNSGGSDMGHDSKPAERVEWVNIGCCGLAAATWGRQHFPVCVNGARQ